MIVGHPETGAFEIEADAIAKNATAAQLTDDGQKIDGNLPGVPFPLQNAVISSGNSGKPGPYEKQE